MAKSRISKIETTLARFLDGDLYTPVKIEGIGVYHATCKRLEELRVTLLKLEDEKLLIDTQNNSAIANVAHDLKTPLAVICGYAECIADGIGDKDYANLILQRAQQMNDMVLSLVETSRKQLQEDSQHKTVHDAREYFLPICRNLESICEPKNIKLKISKIPNVNVRINPHQMGRVMQNLVSNAVKYSPEGSTINVVFSRRYNYLRVKVIDEGVGISRESLPFVFDKFYKEDKSRTDQSSNGLGLYITKNIVTEHGGRIVAHSKKGKGSTFVFAIPIEHEDQEKDFTARADSISKAGKICLNVFLGGWFWGFTYRLAKFFETRKETTLFGAIISLGLFPFMWIVDVISVCVYNKITFLAD